MKSNKSLYILLPVVFIVWGIIIYRLVKYVGQGNAALPTPAFIEANFEPEKLQEDTFTISANYRDPFLGEIKKVEAITGAPKPMKPAPKPVAKPEIPWPTIIFKGLIKNKDAKKTYALLTINGKTKSFSDKEEWQGIKIQSVVKDSVLLIYNKQKRSFKRK
jgi:type II secretory pathway component PulC